MREAGLSFRRLQGADLLAIRKQPSQRTILGIDVTVSPAEAEQLAAQAVAWAAWRGDQLVACLGVIESVPGCMGTCWAVLAEAVGADHLAITRFAREGLAAVQLPRLEAMCLAADVEGALAAYPDLSPDPGQIVAMAMARPTPECRWAMLIGLRPAHLLRRYGPAGQSVMLFERILPAAQQLSEAA